MKLEERRSVGKVDSRLLSWNLNKLNFPEIQVGEFLKKQEDIASVTLNFDNRWNDAEYWYSFTLIGAMLGAMLLAKTIH